MLSERDNRIMNDFARCRIDGKESEEDLESKIKIFQKYYDEETDEGVKGVYLHLIEGFQIKLEKLGVD